MYWHRRGVVLPSQFVRVWSAFFGTAECAAEAARIQKFRELLRVYFQQ
jgi:hypothetical protein